MSHATVIYSLYLALNLLFPHVFNFKIWMKLNNKNYREGIKLQLSIKK